MFRKHRNRYQIDNGEKVYNPTTNKQSGLSKGNILYEIENGDYKSYSTSELKTLYNIKEVTPNTFVDQLDLGKFTYVYGVDFTNNTVSLPEVNQTLPASAFKATKQ